MTSPQSVGGPAQPAAGPAMPGPRKPRRTRLGGLWVGLALFVVVLLLLLVFILENGQRADVGYFGGHGHLPLGVALLLAAVAGALLVLIPGTARIIQLRHRHRALEAGLAATTAEVTTPPDGTGADTPPGPPGGDPAQPG